MDDNWSFFFPPPSLTLQHSTSDCNTYIGFTIIVKNTFDFRFLGGAGIEYIEPAFIFEFFHKIKKTTPLVCLSICKF